MVTPVNLAYWIATNGRPQRPCYNVDGTFSIMEEDAYGREVEVVRLPEDLMIIFKSDFYTQETTNKPANKPAN